MCNKYSYPKGLLKVIYSGALNSTSQYGSYVSYAIGKLMASAVWLRFWEIEFLVSWLQDGI